MKMHCILILTILLNGCSSRPDVVSHDEKNTSTETHRVYIISHGWHSGFVLAAVDILKHTPQLRSRFAGAEYLEFGWGDQGFYQANEITTALTLQAIFWPTDTVVHVVSVKGNLKKYFPESEIEELTVSDAAYRALLSFIDNSMQKDGTGKLIKMKRGIYGDSQFYKGVGQYYLMNTCNKWTAKGLASAGLDISTTFKLTAGSIMRAVRLHNSAVARRQQQVHRTALTIISSD